MRISDWSSDVCSSDLPWLRRHALQVCSEVLAQCLLDTPDPTQALEASQKLLGPILIAAIKSMTASLGISGKKEPYDIDDAVSANLTLLECAAKVHKQVSQHSFFHYVDRLCTETIRTEGRRGGKGV